MTDVPAVGADDVNDPAWLRFRLLVEWDSHSEACTRFTCTCGLWEQWKEFDDEIRRWSEYGD